MKTLGFAALPFALVLLAWPGMGAAQQELGGGDAEHADPPASYPQIVREAAWAVAAHPQLLAELSKLQRQSSAEFAGLLDPYSRKDQEAIWEMARFPGLIDKLAACDPQDEVQLGQVLEEYPEKVGASARQYSRREHDLLVQIARLNEQTETRLTSLLSGHPVQTQGQVRLLLQYPELLSQLTPDAAQARPWQAHAKKADQPAARAPMEVEQKSQARARRYDYDLDNLDEPADDEDVVVVHHYGYRDYPYPYWFGYPRWYGPAGWYLGFNWYLTPSVSATVGVEVPVVRRVVPVYRPYVPRYGACSWDLSPGRGHWNHRGRRH